MTWDDVVTLVGTAAFTTFIGGVALYLFFRWLAARTQERGDANATSGGASSPTIERAIRARIEATPARKAVAERARKQQELDAKVQQARRNIPLGAAATLVERGTRLIAEKAFDEALVCFLALLYSAVEGGPAQPSNLPVHLADCLRGAATCYRFMGQPETAARFLQAERLIYEEMIAVTASGGDQGGASRAIVASLFAGTPGAADDAAAAGVPRRCRVLKEVAQQCEKFGHNEVALSYRVKAAALKRKQSGQALDPQSEEFNSIADILRQMSTTKSGVPTAARGGPASA
jgi:hypothetical protein